jgi:hypothetical protein
MAGALGGQNGSTKQYQQGALGQGLANQNIANMGSNLWMNAANQSNQNAMNAGSQNLGSANNFDQSLMSNYGNFGQLGANMLGDSYDMGRQNLGLQNEAGMFQQGYDQSQIQAQMAKHNFEQQSPWEALAQRNNLTQSWVNPNAIQYGASPFDTALNVAEAGMGLYTAYQDSQDPFGGNPYGNTGNGGSDQYGNYT